MGYSKLRPSCFRKNTHPQIWRNPVAAYRFGRLLHDWEEADGDEPPYYLYDADTNERISLATEDEIAASFSTPKGIILRAGREVYVDV